MADIGPSEPRIKFPHRVQGRLALGLQVLLVATGLAILLSEMPLLPPVGRMGTLLIVPALLAAWLLPWRRGMVVVGLLVVVPPISGAAGVYHLSGVVTQMLAILFAASLTYIANDVRVKEARATQARVIAEAKLERLNALRHELRTPLTIIRGYPDLLLQDAAADPIRAQLERIAEAAERMVAVTDEILDQQPWWLTVSSSSRNLAHVTGRRGRG